MVFIKLQFTVLELSNLIPVEQGPHAVYLKEAVMTQMHAKTTWRKHDLVWFP